MNNFRQQPNEQIHALNTRITTSVNNCKLQDHQTKETIKLLLIQYAVRFHEARDWIRLQDQSQLTYTSLLQHCKTLEEWCEQFQKAQVKGCTELTTCSAATATSSSVHQDTITIHYTQCMKCGYKHPQGNCSVTGKECYNCHGTGHYTALCRHPKGEKTVITGPPAGPTTGNPAATDIAIILQEDTGSPTTEAPATVLTTHANHLTTQEGTGGAPHQNSIRSVTSHPIFSQAQKINYPQM